jgi:putative oxygen-independent coproporphyrinogen III oxidase
VNRVSLPVSPGLALYLHIPFCRSRCHYCDFTSTAGATPAEIASYADLLRRELAAGAALRPAGSRADTLYFGGGTPSLLPPRLVARLMDEAAALYGLTDDAEVTLEANPGTVNTARLAAYRRAGVNRLSLGVQSFADVRLARLGRLHTARQARTAVAAARKAGFTRVGLDLICGLPEQTPADWQADLAEACRLAPEHLSVYSLSVEEGTPFAALAASGRLPLPTEEVTAAMLGDAADCLAAAGYEQYEISNFARPGHRSRHNQVYWQRGDYLGFGAGAHSFLRQAGYGCRWSNPTDLAAYAASLGRPRPPADAHLLDRAEAMAEFFFLGLRLLDGVEPARFRDEFGLTVEAAFPGAVARLAAAGLLQEAAGRLALTRRGLLLANQVFLAFL